MEVILWGVRGSISNPDRANQFYGTNTTCIEVRPSPDLLIILDAGSGIRSLSKTLPDAGECHIFITHAHSDHIQGLSFFAPFFNPGWTITLHVPPHLEQLPYRLFDGNSFPVSFADLAADIHIRTIDRDCAVTFDDNGRPVRMEAFEANHPGGGLAYKLITPEACVLYSGDHEITRDPAVLAQTRRMLSGADLALVDAMFSKEDYRPGWGHSAWEDWAREAENAGVGTLVLSHHTPDRTDPALDALGRELAARSDGPSRSCTQTAVAREGMRFSLPGPVKIDRKTSDWLQLFIDSLAEFREETTLLDHILSKTREIAGADAGSMYLVEDDELVFAYSQNDTLFPDNARNKSMYVNMRMPLAGESVAGFVAVTGETLNLDDVHAVPGDRPFRFNSSFDWKTGYSTRSMLTLPICGTEGRMLGVLQLINCLDPRTGKVVPFPPTIADSLRALMREVAIHLEISAQVYRTVYRLLHIAMLHDPAETGPHAERVGAIAAEIYQRWAERNNIPPEQLRAFKNRLRLAAMVHDIGKVGISDTVLKKPGKLTDEEFAVMKTHTSLGAELFSAEPRDITELAREIAYHHHQKWNGRGYPPVDGKALAGTQIPLSARITAIADVFDALVSPRCYKEPWTFERAVALLRDEAGEHFDPELVACFMELVDVLDMIYARYPDQPLHGEGPDQTGRS